MFFEGCLGVYESISQHHCKVDGFTVKSLKLKINQVMQLLYLAEKTKMLESENLALKEYLLIMKHAFLIITDVDYQ